MAKEDTMTGLVKRGAVYWLRVRVPSDVRAAMGKRECCYSLKTRERTVALQRLSIERVKIEAEFAKVRRAGASVHNPESVNPELVDLQPEEIQRIISCWFHDVELRHAKADRELLAEGSKLRVSSMIQDLREDEATLCEENAPPPTDAEPITWGAREADALLAAHGIKLDPSADQYQPAPMEERYKSEVRELYRRAGTTSDEACAEREGQQDLFQP